MKLPDILSARQRLDRTTVLAVAGFLIASIAFADFLLSPAVSLGFLYLYPIMMAALFVSRTELLGLAILCTLLREILGPFQWDWGVGVRAFFGLVSYFGLGLFVVELARRRRQTLEHLRVVEEQERLRRAAEEQLKVLIETSPAAIITVDTVGRIQVANQAAHQVLGSEDQPLTGEPVGAFLPLLAGVPQADGGGRVLRTTLECRGRRRDGEVFLAHIWLSTFLTSDGPRLAAIVFDTSEDLRDREELGLHRLMTSSRVLVRAVSHEIRNLCAGIAVVHANLRRVPGVAASEDFQALGTLVDGLGRLVSAELRPPSENSTVSVDLREVLDELRIVIEPSLRDEEIEVRWKVAEDLPPVYADRHGLLHVFMNLANNSQRAMRGSEQKELAIAATVESGRVVVRFIDTGPGVARPEQLFQAFQQAAEGAGLGLYLSRALVRSFAGELRHEPRAYGCCFAVELAAARSAAELS
ncbi:MAG TPA: ATP-binding protein [Bryobacteraceae bacterium]|nr:ATP-binding protein [Bryobacteraceae bacterium]